MNIQALFAAKENRISKTRNVQGEFVSPICNKLDNLIEHLEVYRADFKGTRVPMFE